MVARVCLLPAQPWPQGSALALSTEAGRRALGPRFTRMLSQHFWTHCGPDSWLTQCSGTSPWPPGLAGGGGLWGKGSALRLPRPPSRLAWPGAAARYTGQLGTGVEAPPRSPSWRRGQQPFRALGPPVQSRQGPASHWACLGQAAGGRLGSAQGLALPAASGPMARSLGLAH